MTLRLKLQYLTNLPINKEFLIRRAIQLSHFEDCVRVSRNSLNKNTLMIYLEGEDRDLSRLWRCYGMLEKREKVNRLRQIVHQALRKDSHAM